MSPVRGYALKRPFDLACSLTGLALLLPVFAGVAVAIKLMDPGPVFFRQERIGLHGRPFRIWKFRTMVVDAPRMGAAITVGADSRITRVGGFLRKYKLDELPQLLNVATGEMSLVGPRPEVPRYVALYTEAQREVLRLKPGITDWASIKYRDESAILAKAEDPETMYRKILMPDKIRLNLDYAGKASLVKDISVIIATLIKVGK